MSARGYGGSYKRGSKAGGRNNQSGQEAEQLLDQILRDSLKLVEGTDYLKQRRVPYLSEERFRRISCSYAFLKVDDQGLMVSVCVDGEPGDPPPDTF